MMNLGSIILLFYEFFTSSEIAKTKRYRNKKTLHHIQCFFMYKFISLNLSSKVTQSVVL